MVADLRGTQDYLSDSVVWDRRIAEHPDGHVLQSWAWGELKARFGWRPVRVSVPGAAIQVLFRPLPAGLGSLGYVPRGPALALGESQTAEVLWSAVHDVAQKHQAICLKVEPDWDDTPEAVVALRSWGFRPSPQPVQPQRTLLVGLDAEPEELLARMKQKTRYNVRLASRRGVTVRPGSEAELPLFQGLMQVTATRDEFGIHSAEYYRAVYQLFVPRGHARLLLAEHDGQLLAGLMAFAFGTKAWYMYGASGDEGRELMPNYLLQWKAMRWAQGRGARVYDLWGVPDEDEETLEAQFTQRRDGLWGVYRFKRGFGGRLVRTVGAWDWVYSPLRYRLYTYAVRAITRYRHGSQNGLERSEAGRG
jgi:lipid II:glycine glycyltransferase (peptidoglycan interpeptide bridge formation enzyme)